MKFDIYLQIAHDVTSISLFFFCDSTARFLRSVTRQLNTGTGTYKRKSKNARIFHYGNDIRAKQKCPQFFLKKRKPLRNYCVVLEKDVPPNRNDAHPSTNAHPPTIPPMFIFGCTREAYVRTYARDHRISVTTNVYATHYLVSF